ncbi:MAG: EamA family transporter [Thermoprotei archaeon]|nr:MAG: EamA family transporter [Thermoprotei archaeon]
MIWFILALLSAIFAALVTIFAKIGLARLDPVVATGLRAIVMSIFIIGYIVYSKKTPLLLNLTSKESIYILLSGLAGALSWLFYFAALKIGEASKVAMVDRSSILFIIVLSIILLGEKVTLQKIVAAILIFLGLLTLTI